MLRYLDLRWQKLLLKLPAQLLLWLQASPQGFFATAA